MPADPALPYAPVEGRTLGDYGVNLASRTSWRALLDARSATVETVGARAATLRSSDHDVSRRRRPEDSSARETEGIVGYLAYRSEKNNAWTGDPGFLTGAAGVALALLAATSDVRPRWARALLID